MMSSRFSPTEGSGNPAFKFLGSVLILGTIAALIAFAVLYNKKKPCKEFTCPDGKTNRVNSKGTSIEECCYTATPTGTPVGGGGEEEPEEPEETITQGGKKKNVGMIVGAAIGGVLLLIIIGFAIFAVIGRRSLDPKQLAELRTRADARANEVLGASRLASAVPIASRSYLAGSLAMEGMSQTAARAASLYRKATSLATMASKKRNPAEAAEKLGQATTLGDKATDLAGAASAAAASLSAVGPSKPYSGPYSQRSTSELLSAVDAASSRLRV